MKIDLIFPSLNIKLFKPKAMFVLKYYQERQKVFISNHRKHLNVTIVFLKITRLCVSNVFSKVIIRDTFMKWLKYLVVVVIVEMSRNGIL